MPTGISAFYYIPNCLGQPAPFRSAPFHFTIWTTHSFDGKYITWEEKGRKKKQLVKERKHERNFKFSNIQHVLHTNLLYEIITTSVTVVSLATSFTLLVSILNAIISSIFFLSMTYLTWLKYHSWLKMILSALENHPHLKVVLRKMTDTSLCVHFLLNFLSKERKPQGENLLILISTLSEFQKGFSCHLQL